MKKRDITLDVLKGICIILVVFAHAHLFSKIPSDIVTFVNTIFLNCFFIVSGWLIYAKNIVSAKYEICYRFIGLIVPYLFFSLVAIVYQAIFSVGLGSNVISAQYTGFRLILRNIFVTFTGMGIGTLWFLPVIFVADVCGILFKKFSYHRLNNYYYWILYFILIYLLLGISWFFLAYSQNGLSTNLATKMLVKYSITLNRLFYGSAFTISGILLHHLKDKLLNSHIKTILFLVAGILLIVVFRITELIELYTLISATVFSILVMTIAKAIKNMRLASKITDFLAFNGRKSLEIMIYHYIFTLPLLATLLNYFVSRREQLTTKWEIISFFLNYLLTLLVIYFLDKFSFVDFMMGRGKSFRAFKLNILNKLFSNKSARISPSTDRLV